MFELKRFFFPVTETEREATVKKNTMCIENIIGATSPDNCFSKRVNMIKSWFNQFNPPVS